MNLFFFVNWAIRLEYTIGVQKKNKQVIRCQWGFLFFWWQWGTSEKKKTNKKKISNVCFFVLFFVRRWTKPLVEIAESELLQVLPFVPKKFLTFRSNDF